MSPARCGASAGHYAPTIADAGYRQTYPLVTNGSSPSEVYWALSQ